MCFDFVNSSNKRRHFLCNQLRRLSEDTNISKSTYLRRTYLAHLSDTDCQLILTSAIQKCAAGRKTSHRFPLQKLNEEQQNPLD